MSKFNVTDIDLGEVSFVGKGANQEAHVILMKRMEGEMPKLEDLQKELKKLQKEHDELKTANDELQKTHDELQADHDELKKSADKKDDKDDINKDDLPEAVKKHLEKQDEELQSQAKVIAKMADERLEKDWISKAGDVLLVGEADEVGKLLKSIAETSPEIAEATMAILKAANSRIAKGNLFKELGTGGETEIEGALGELNKKAHEMAKAESITFEKAFAKVYKKEHTLRKQYLNEKK